MSSRREAMNIIQDDNFFNSVIQATTVFFHYIGLKDEEIKILRPTKLISTQLYFAVVNVMTGHKTV